MATDDDARLIGAIADAIAYAGVQRGGDALLYAEAGSGWVRGSIFIEGPAEIEWVSPADYHIDKLILRLWASAPDTKKWRALIMVVGQDLFRTEFDFGESWSEDQDESDRRDAFVQRYFGDKPVEYPSLDASGGTSESANFMMFKNN